MTQRSDDERRVILTALLERAARVLPSVVDGLGPKGVDAMVDRMMRQFPADELDAVLDGGRG
jgi:hypothetical protein